MRIVVIWSTGHIVSYLFTRLVMAGHRSIRVRVTDCVNLNNRTPHGGTSHESGQSIEKAEQRIFAFGPRVAAES